MSDWVWWLVAAGALAAAEVATLTIFFGLLAVAALIGALVEVLGGSTPLQFIIALVSAVPLLAVVRPFTLKMFHRDTPDLVTGTAGYIGRPAIVTQQVAPRTPGQVSLHGEIWPAICSDPDQTLAVGAHVTVTGREGSTLTVRLT